MPSTRLEFVSKAVPIVLLGIHQNRAARRALVRKVACLFTFVFAFTTAAYVDAQEMGQDVNDLKARLGAMEKRLEQLMQQNAELSKSLSELPTPPVQKQSESKSSEQAN